MSKSPIAIFTCKILKKLEGAQKYLKMSSLNFTTPCREGQISKSAHQTPPFLTSLYTVRESQLPP